jgi:ubiquitin thioesterase protein OTUB1
LLTLCQLLASAWIQSHPGDFEPFLNMPLKTYVSHHIEAANCEIDNVAVVALAEAIVKPAGFGLQIMYLDRSPGEEINNTYRAEPTGHDGLPLQNPPTMRLLYRP